jgi:hypothetical protein
VRAIYLSCLNVKDREKIKGVRNDDRTVVKEEWGRNTRKRRGEDKDIVTCMHDYRRGLDW